MNEKPTRCIDPVIKYCQECPLGWVKYPDWVETLEDLRGCTFESGCCYLNVATITSTRIVMVVILKELCGVVAQWRL